jgi:hypothetical protein
MRETSKQLKLTMLERLICADILEFADWGDSLQRCTPRGFGFDQRQQKSAALSRLTQGTETMLQNTLC